MPASLPELHPPGSRTVRTIRTGSSGATVTITERPDGSLIAVKAARCPPVTAAAQARARASIEPYLGDRLPAVLFAGSRGGVDLLITDCPAVATLADAPAGDPRAEQAWQDAVRALTHVWASSARPGYAPELATRNHHRRVQRGIGGLRHTLRTLGRNPAAITVNGVRCTLDSLTARLANPPTPQMHVACQGDPQPRNILLSPDGTWHLIDWEWAGLHHDWRMLTSHLAGWWHTHSILTHGQGQLTSSRNILDVAHDPMPPSLHPAIMNTAISVFNTFTHPSRRHRDLQALSVHTALLLLREIPRTVHAPHTTAALLGEVTALLGNADTVHPLIEPFTRPVALTRTAA